jgi:hypothetical protein
MEIIIILGLSVIYVYGEGVKARIFLEENGEIVI